jgi:class 3 adenylate cyclase
VASELLAGCAACTRPLAARLGDRRWQALLGQHHRLVREQLARLRGREIHTAGDGFFATFDGPARHPRRPGHPRASTLWACRSAPGCTPARWRAHGREGRRDRPCIDTARSVTRRGETVALCNSLPVRLPVRLPGYTGPPA